MTIIRDSDGTILCGRCRESAYSAGLCPALDCPTKVSLATMGISDGLQSVETPETDIFYTAWNSWAEYSKQYGHIPEAMEQCPLDQTQQEFAQNMERRVVVLKAELQRLRVENRELRKAKGSG